MLTSDEKQADVRPPRRVSHANTVFPINQDVNMRETCTAGHHLTSFSCCQTNNLEVESQIRHRACVHQSGTWFSLSTSGRSRWLWLDLVIFIVPSTLRMRPWQLSTALVSVPRWLHNLHKIQRAPKDFAKWRCQVIIQNTGHFVLLGSSQTLRSASSHSLRRFPHSSPLSAFKSVLLLP